MLGMCNLDKYSHLARCQHVIGSDRHFLLCDNHLKEIEVIAVQIRYFHTRLRVGRTHFGLPHCAQ